MLLPQEIIRHIRDKQVLPAEEIQAFVKGITDESVSEAQIGRGDRETRCAQGGPE